MDQSPECDDCGSIRSYQHVNGCRHSKKTLEGETKPGMSIDWDQFNEGDEVAVTLVGTWHVDKGIGPSLVTPSTTRLYQSAAVFTDVVDAYRIEPDYEPGDMVRDKFSGLWRKLPEGRWVRLVGGQCYLGPAPEGAVRVKVVDA